MNMNKRMKLGLILLLAAALVLPTSAYAAAHTDWTKSAELYEIRTWAGDREWGLEDGNAAEAKFFHPRSIAELPDGRLLIADSSNHRLRVLDGKQSITYAGMDTGSDYARMPIGAYHDDSLELAAFNKPSGIAIDSDGIIYVADADNHSIRRIGKDGRVTTLAGSGMIGLDDGTGKEATFHSPSDVAVDKQGNVYVADTLNHAIRKILPDGKVETVTAVSSRIVEYVPGAVEAVGDFQDGPIAKAKFNEPSGLAVDEEGNLYISDRGNQRIRYMDIAAGTVATVAGGGEYGPQAPYVKGDFTDGLALEARFDAPEGLAIAQDGTLVVADSLNHAIRLLRDGSVTTLTGVPTEYGYSDGVPYAAQFNHPTDVAILSDGRLAIADEYGNAIRVLQSYKRPEGLPDDNTITVLIDGEQVATDVRAELRAGATLLPLRSVGDALGYEVDYDDETNEAILIAGDTTYRMKKGSVTVFKSSHDGVREELMLNGEPVIVQNRLLVPVRFFAEELGLDIRWDTAERNVVIRHLTFEER